MAAVSRSKNLVDAIRGATERIVRAAQANGQSFEGRVSDRNGDLKVGQYSIDPTDPFHDLIATAVGKHLGFDGQLNGSKISVLDVRGIVTANTPKEQPGETVSTGVNAEAREGAGSTDAAPTAW